MTAASGTTVPFVSSRDQNYNPLTHLQISYGTGPQVQQTATSVCYAVDNLTGNGTYFLTMNLMVNGQEFAYLVKLNNNLTVAWGHYWGMGHMEKVLYHPAQNAVMAYGHSATGRVLLASVDLNDYTGTTTAAYNWTQSVEAEAWTKTATVESRDMVIEPSTGDLILLAESDTGMANVTTDYMLFRCDETTGMMIWTEVYDLFGIDENAATVCIGPPAAGWPYSITFAGSRGSSNIQTTSVDPWGNILWSTIHPTPSGKTLL